jgi:hypothetical protein
MIIVDTSVWIQHLNKGDEILTNLLEKGEVAVHDYVLGELASGNIKNRTQFLNLLQDLHRITSITIEEFLIFTEKFNLNGMGLAFVDINLLASAKLSGYPIFTYDKNLKSVAKMLNLNY